MADPTMSHASDPSSRPSPSEPDAARPAHDRELPVTPVDGDGAQRDEQHVAPEEQADGSAQSEPGEGSAVQAAPAQGTLTEDQVKIALRRVKDPELNLNILDLGLVYEIRVNGNAVAIDMSLTSPGCPSGPEIMTDADTQLRAIPGVGDVSVNLVWSPFWSPDRIEPRVRAYLGF
jgi:metal-sulfur cluster biosynthetic enzyme